MTPFSGSCFHERAESTGSRGFTYWRLRFRAWRGSRPFWAGLITLLGGLPIAYFPYAEPHFGNLTWPMSTTAGAGSLIIGVLLVTLGLTMWFHSVVRIFAGVAAILLGLVSIPVSNLGGFGLGLILALVGGALVHRLGAPADRLSPLNRTTAPPTSHRRRTTPVTLSFPLRVTGRTRTQRMRLPMHKAGGTVRGDDTEPVLAGDASARTRSGPRHAAPRKSFLTKLHIPAGKAFALAAMPTAVFVGMGLTPRLALADEHHDIPFAPGPCVTRSDGPKDPSASGSSSSSLVVSGGHAEARCVPVREPRRRAERGQRAEPVHQPVGHRCPVPPAGRDAEPEDAVRAGPDGIRGAGVRRGPAGLRHQGPAGPVGARRPAGRASRRPRRETGQPDVQYPGDRVGHPGEPAPGSGSTAPARPTGTAGITGTTTHDDTGDTPADTARDTVRKTVTGATEHTVKDAARDPLRSAIEDAAKQAGAKVEELGASAKSLEPGTDDDIPAGAEGKPRFPCPTPDPQALADATEEGGIPLLANEPWKLHSTKLTLIGLKYHGIKKVRTYDNALKPVLKFTAEAVDIRDLHQTAQYPGNRTAHVQAAPGSTSTIRQGTVTLYVEELKGNLFGLLPITFSPRTPPPVDIPYVVFTDVDVAEAGQFGGTLTIPGMHNYVSG